MRADTGEQVWNYQTTPGDNWDYDATQPLMMATLSIDGAWCTVGSYNLDWRSLVYNWEVTLEVLDASAAEELEDKFRDDLEFCEPVDPDEFRGRGLWDKVRERFFYFFRVWL